MTDQNLIIDGVDHAKFDLEWAKRGGRLICEHEGGERTLGVLSLTGDSIETGTLLFGVIPIWQENQQWIARMATPAECEAAGVEYIKRPVSDQSLSDLQQRAQAALRYAEKLRGIFHVSMLKAYPQKSHQEISDEIDNTMKEVIQ